MKIKLKVILIIVLVALAATTGALAYMFFTGNDDREDPVPGKKDTWNKVTLTEGFSGKVGQWSEILGTVERKIPAETRNEGLNDRYPVYGTSLSEITDEEKDNILSENSMILASSSTYDSMDEYGNLYLNGEKTGRTLYKHTASVGMYYGNVSDDEQALVKKITVATGEQRNFITGLYAPAGEVVKIEISETDLEAIGGNLLVTVGQVSHRNNINNIWKARNDFCRMPVIADQWNVKTTTAYVGNPLGGPIYIYPSVFGKTFTVTISGAVGYAHYIHGQTTKSEVEAMKKYSAPYYDFEVWDLGVRMSGPAQYGNYDYDNLVKAGDLWEKIIRTSRRVPCSANETIGTGYVYDCFVAAGSAVAFQGGHSWVNAPPSWMRDALNYESLTTDGSWGNLHEFNHLYQSYGMENSKTNEVTNNATTLLSYSLYTKISEKRSLNDNDLTGWNRYTDPSRSLRETLSAAESGTKQTALNAYADLIHTFGVDLFTAATRAQNRNFGVDGWYDALSSTTGYNFTYYFENILHQPVSDESKAKYDVPDRPLFIPVACVFQTGRSYFSGNGTAYSDTVMPYRIERGEPLTIDLNERLILPSDFTFRVKSISSPENGTIEKVTENVYRYTPGENSFSGKIELCLTLSGENYGEQEVTLLLGFRQYDKNQTEIKKYSYDGETKYSTVAEAVENDFAGYTDLTESRSGSTFVNGLKNGQIGVVEGEIFIEKTSKYAFCLRSGRGNNTLYLAVNEKNDLQQVLSLDSDHIGFALEGEHVVTLDLQAGDYVYFREITLSRHYADAFTELGMADLTLAAPVMRTVATSSLYLSGVTVTKETFVAPERYKRGYSTTATVRASSSGDHTLVSVNMPSWSDNEKIENIFDGDPSTYYHNNRNNFVSAENPFVLVVDAGELRTYNSLKIVSRTSGQYNLPCTFELFASADGEIFTLIDKFTDMPFVNNTVAVKFPATELRYYKLVVTDTKSLSTGNKYVTIAEIELSYTLAGAEKSPYAAEYYACESANFGEVVAPSSFGKMIAGNGNVKYSFEGKAFVLFVRQAQACRIRVTLDANGEEAREIVLSPGANGEREIAYAVGELSRGAHTVTIETLEGRLFVDSFLEAE